MEALPLFFPLRGRPVLLLGDGTGAEPKRRLLQSAGAAVETDEAAALAAGARIAVVAIDEDREAARTASRLRAAGLLVNVVDKPALCDFSFPAIVDRAPVTLAIGTGGASATLSKTLRERLEALLPAGLGGLAEAVRMRRRAVNTALPDAAARRGFWDALFAPGGALDPLGTLPDDPGAAIDAALADSPPSGASLIEIVPRSADPDDLSLKELRALSRADIVLWEEGFPQALLTRARRDARIEPARAGAEKAGGHVVVLRRFAGDAGAAPASSDVPRGSSDDEKAKGGQKHGKGW